MHKIMNFTVAVSFILCTVFTLLLCVFKKGIFLSFAVTFAVIAYHFGVRLLVGHLYNKFMNNQTDIFQSRYQTRQWENKLYQILKVKKWKDKMPTYDNELFSPKYHTYEEIAMAMCQSEMVHKTNVILSLVPILATFWFGSLAVFLITSVCAALFDTVFVVIQRYNRPRIIRIVLKQQAKNAQTQL